MNNNSTAVLGFFFAIINAATGQRLELRASIVCAPGVQRRERVQLAWFRYDIASGQLLGSTFVAAAWQDEPAEVAKLGRHAERLIAKKELAGWTRV